MKNKTFLRIFLLSFMIVAASFTGFSKEKVFESSWIASAVEVDGINNEWGTGSLGFVKKVKVDYAFMNDAKNLYVLFIFKDQKYLSSISFTGVTIWLNVEGKKKRIYGVNFREKKVTADELIASIEKKEGPMPEADKQKVRANPHYFIYQGNVIDKKRNILIEASLTGGKNEPGFRSKPQKEGIVHEFKVPLNILEKLSTDQTLEPGRVVKVGFEWGGWSKELLEAASSRMGAAGSKARDQKGSSNITQGGGDPRGVQRMRTGEAPGIAAMRKRQPKKYNFWVDLKLAQKE